MTNPILLSPQDVERAFALIAICADPAGSKERLDAIAAGYAKLEKATREHDAARKRHDERLAELQAVMATQAAELQKKQTAHETALAKASSKHEAECDARRQALDVRESKLFERETAVDAKATAVSAREAAHAKRCEALDAALRPINR
jgi:hypothetical protein